MPWEALLWTALAVLSPSLSGAIWLRIEGRIGEWAESLRALGPWVHGVAPAYLALITGAILSRDAGLRGHDPAAWIGGAFICALILAAVGIARRHRSPLAVWPDPLQAMADEPRWTLYRAAGALWTWSHALGTAVGLGLSLIEWALAYRPWRFDPARRLAAGAVLARMASSTLFFALTRNFWLTALSQYLLMTLLRRKPGEGAGAMPLAGGGPEES